jgi:hypothetical protein
MITVMLRRFVVSSLFFGALLAGLVGAEENDGPLPQTPTAFETEPTGDTSEGTADFLKPGKGSKKKLSFTAVTKSRDWRDAKGKLVRGRLLAFESGKVTTGEQPLTLIKEGRIRLLVDGAKKVSKVPLSSLSSEDQAFVKKLAAQKKKASP